LKAVIQEDAFLLSPTLLRHGGFTDQSARQTLLPSLADELSATVAVEVNYQKLQSVYAAQGETDAALAR